MEIVQHAQEQLDHIAKRCNRIKPLVMINCITYNHANYLRNALDGFISQNTEFPYVAIVHDDASTDESSTILRHYAEKYPDIILPIYEEENQYSTQTDMVSRIMQEARIKSGAKYIAYCEGDDYWTDPLKLQKQIDFMEANPDYSMCFNKIEVLNEFTGERYPLANVATREYLPNEIIESLMLQTASVVIRSDVYTSQRYLKAKADSRFRSGDIVLYLSAAAIGRIYCIADLMSVYRVNPGGVTNAMRRDPFMFVNEVKLMKEHFGDLFSRSFNNNLAKGYLRTLLIGIKTFSPKVAGKSVAGLAKYIWFLKPKTLKRSIYRKRRK